MPILTIHAANITGLGASEVVLSILKGINTCTIPFNKVICYLPSKGPVSKFKSNSSNLEIRHIKRKIPNSISRALECLFPRLYIEIGDMLLVLGDVPLRTYIPQVVFFQQSHLLKTEINSMASKSFKFRVMRLIFSLNQCRPNKFIVQSDAMYESLLSSYPLLKKDNKVKVIYQPAPLWVQQPLTHKPHHDLSKGLILFYPAADYPHKNHSLFYKLVHKELREPIHKLILTIDKPDFRNLPSWIVFSGMLDHKKCLYEYHNADALVFPSLIESYGLPLIEAMTLGLPIIVSDLPYARALCGDQAIYFDPTSSRSLISACKKLHEKLLRGWRPDWSKQLTVIPENWNLVADQFIKILT